MAVWIYVYGKNGLLADSDLSADKYLNVLNNIPLEEVKILDSMKEAGYINPFSRKHYTEYREKIENDLKSKSIEEYKSYLDSIKYPYIDIDKIIDYFIENEERIKKDKEFKFKNIYKQFESGQIKSNWEFINETLFANKLCEFSLYDGLRVRLINDLIQISGPFPVFSIYSIFQKQISVELRDYYHSYFKKVLKSFNSDFILYGHEWSGIDDEEDSEFNLAKLKEQSDWENTNSDSIHTMDRFYYEKI